LETETIATQPIFTDGDITVTGNNLIYHNQKIALTEVTAIRYGWLPIRLDMFRIGGRYVLELKTVDQKIRMSFHSYFGLFKKRQSEKFNTLLDVIWDATIVRLLNEMVADIDNGQTVTIGKCSVCADGIHLKSLLITWDDLSYQRNYNKLTINSKSKADIWTNLYYTETDNVHVLMHFLEWKLENQRDK
jgi:hypothetical protein